MTPAFSSWHAFFAMGGYAFYVWLAVAGSVLVLSLLIGWGWHAAEQERERDRQAMLGLLGYASLDALTERVLPDSIKGSSVLPMTTNTEPSKKIASPRSPSAR